MKLLLNDENIILEILEEVTYAKAGGVDGGLQICSEHEATHILIIEKNLAYMANVEKFGMQIVEVGEVPEHVTESNYKYENCEFIEYMPEPINLEL